LLGGSYTHPPISEVTCKEEVKEPILNVDDIGRFKVVHYSQKDNNKGPTTSKETIKDDSNPKKFFAKEPLPKNPPKKDPPTKANKKNHPPRKENTKKKENGKEVRLDIDIETTIGKISIYIYLKDIAKILEKKKHIEKSLVFEEGE